MLYNSIIRIYTTLTCAPMYSIDPKDILQKYYQSLIDLQNCAVYRSTVVSSNNGSNNKIVSKKIENKIDTMQNKEYANITIKSI